jgi:hypothetical protein
MLLQGAAHAERARGDINDGIQRGLRILRIPGDVNKRSGKW